MKALNVFAIILAWILSIAMVVMLVAAPLALSALSLVDPENIVQIVSQSMLDGNKSAAMQPRETYAVQKLSAETEAVSEEKPADINAASGLLQGIQGIVGDNVSEEMLNKVLTSDAMSELLRAYTKDLTNVIVGKDSEKQFTPELLVEVVQDNLDEIVEIVEESGMSLTDEQKSQFKSQLQTAVEDNAEKIVENIPAAEEVKESLIDGNKEMEIAFTILAKKNEIKGAIVGMIVLISVLIFALRYPGFRGLRWLSTNLFTAGGFNVIICLVMGMASSAYKGVTEGVNAIAGTAVDGIIGMLLSQLAKGVIIRTVVIFVAAIALLVGYILLKIFVRKKKAKTVAPAAEEIIPETVLTPVEVPAAPVYTAVAIEPELVSDPVPQEKTAEEKPAEEV